MFWFPSLDLLIFFVIQSHLFSPVVFRTFRHCGSTHQRLVKYMFLRQLRRELCISEGATPFRLWLIGRLVPDSKKTEVVQALHPGLYLFNGKTLKTLLIATITIKSMNEWMFKEILFTHLQYESTQDVLKSFLYENLFPGQIKLICPEVLFGKNCYVLETNQHYTL